MTSSFKLQAAPIGSEDPSGMLTELRMGQICKKICRFSAENVQKSF